VKLNFIIYLLAIAFLLAGCATYHAPNQTMTSCKDYEAHLSDSYNSDYLQYLENNPDEALPLSQWTDRFEGRNAPSPTKPIIVRYSESGDLVSRCDYSFALKAIKDIDKPKLIVVYIHGWNNDSGSTKITTYNNPANELPPTSGGDLANFDIFLERLRKNERQSAETPREVVGIFVSWKGATPMKYLNYYSRKRGADILSRSAHIPRLLSSIENISEKQEQRPKNPYDNTLIYMGHSFGARILYSAVAPTVINDTQDQFCEGGYIGSGEDEGVQFGEIKTGPDLVLLANPVVSSSFYKAFDEFRYTQCHFGYQEKPLMVTLQSEADAPTRLWYSAAENFERIFFLNSDTRRRTAYGHFSNHQTHTLERDSNCNPAKSAIGLNEEFCANGIALKYAPPFKPENVERSQKPSPFIVAKTSKDILKGHGWLSEHTALDSDDTIFNWMLAYIQAHEEK